MIENKQKRLMSIASFSGVFGVTRRKSAKQKINWQAAGEQRQPRQSRRSAIAKQDNENHAGANDVKRRHNGITKRLVRPLRQRLRSAQTKNSDDRQNVKNQNGGDDVVQQIAIKIAVFSADRIVRARQNQKRGPHALHQQRDSWHSSAIQNSGALEEQPIARHRVIRARTGEQHSVDAAESGNHDGQSH